jgi:hypothetical protein
MEQYHYQEPAMFFFEGRNLQCSSFFYTIHFQSLFILSKMTHPGLNWKDPMCSIEAGEWDHRDYYRGIGDPSTRCTSWFIAFTTHYFLHFLKILRCKAIGIVTKDCSRVCAVFQIFYCIQTTLIVSFIHSLLVISIVFSVWLEESVMCTSQG